MLVVHFGMSGQFHARHRPRGARRRTPTWCSTFQQGGDLRFVDPRTFGEMFVATADELGKVKELQHLAIDPLDQVFTWPTFQYLLAQRAAKMKPLLMDQKFISGLGNIYSDEVLFARGAPVRPDERHAVVAGGPPPLPGDPGDPAGGDQGSAGTTLDDEAYVDLFGKPGEYQNELKVYGREGLPCRRCRTPIQSVKIAAAERVLLPAVPELNLSGRRRTSARLRRSRRPRRASA